MTGCAFALRDSGACVFIADCDPICAQQACIEFFQAAAIESVVPEMDVSVSLTGSFVFTRWSLCDGAVFGSISESGLRHWPSVPRDVGFKDVARDIEQTLMLASGRLPVSIEADQSSFQFFLAHLMCDHRPCCLCCWKRHRCGSVFWKVKNSWESSGEGGYMRLF